MARVVTPQTTEPANTTYAIPHEKIAMRAFEKWCQRGMPGNSQLVDWLEAERELQAEYTRTYSKTRR